MHMSLIRPLIRLFVAVPMLLAAAPAIAYIGPGSGLSLLGGLWSLLLGLVLALGAIVLWPLRRLLRRLGLAGRGDDLRGQYRSGAAGDQDFDAPSTPRIPGWRAIAIVGLGLGVLAWLGGPPPDFAPAGGRVVVLGFDGMDPQLARRWMYELKLPNFQRLARDGHFQALGTSNPPQSPVAWSDFATGQHAGHHGIFDFLRRDPQTYTPRFSISEDIAPESHLELFGLSVPLGRGETINRRAGAPFWRAAEQAGARASVLRVPVTYPPDDIHRMLSGMGVPDLLGTQGTYTFYSTTRVANRGGNTRVVRVRPDPNGVITSALEGPVDPLRPGAGPMRIALEIAPRQGGARVRLGTEMLELDVGAWSHWVPVAFDVTGPARARGNVRMLLTRGYPRPRLYVSPIQIDPRAPAVGISSPPGYAAELATRIGLYHTIGMPEETWSLNEEHVSDAAWLDMEKTILAEREAMWYDTLARNDSELVVGVFVQTDRVSHMFWRGLDPQHPRHADTAPEHRDAIEWIYRQADRIVGETLDRLGPDDDLIVLSDHGFAPFRHAVHLNRWLADNGYLVLADDARRADAPFQGVDWSRTRAYAMGLNGVFVNLAGREGRGIVQPGQAGALKRELADALVNWREPGHAGPVIRRVFDTDTIYADSRRPEETPDLVIGYARGYRASWQTTLGAVPEALIEPNDQKWSGDHCIDPALVPGVLSSSFGLDLPLDSIRDVRGLVEQRLAGLPDRAAAARPGATPARGWLDMPGLVLARIDRSLGDLVPAIARVAGWALLSAWLTMWIYARTSNQRRLAALKPEARRLRRAIGDYQGRFAGLLPLIGRNLRLSIQHLALALGPALLAGLPVLLVLVWLSGAYGVRAPMAGSEVRVALEAEAGVTSADWHWHGTAARGLDDSDADAAWVLAWPMPALPAALHAGKDGSAEDTGSAAVLATLPPQRPVPVLHKRRWWNTLIANPAGYLPEDSPIAALAMQLPRVELLPFGPAWMRGWMFVYFTLLVAGAVLLKIRWRVH